MRRIVASSKGLPTICMASGRPDPIKSGADGNRRVAGHVEDRGQVWPLKKWVGSSVLIFGAGP